MLARMVSNTAKFWTLHCCITVYRCRGRTFNLLYINRSTKSKNHFKPCLLAAPIINSHANQLIGYIE